MPACHPSPVPTPSPANHHSAAAFWPPSPGAPDFLGGIFAAGDKQPSVATVRGVHDHSACTRLQGLFSSRPSSLPRILAFSICVPQPGFRFLPIAPVPCAVHQTLCMGANPACNTEHKSVSLPISPLPKRPSQRTTSELVSLLLLPPISNPASSPSLSSFLLFIGSLFLFVPVALLLPLR